MTMDSESVSKGMGCHLSGLQNGYESDSSERDTSQTPPVRQKRKYRCRVRSPATIERAKRQRRDKANARERRRMNSLNDALELLRQILPQSGEEPKMTKIETLRTAQQYISFLTRSLDPSSDISSPLPSPIFSSVPPADISTQALMHDHLFSGLLPCKTDNHSFLSYSNSPSFSTHYTPDPSPAYPQY